MCNLVVQQVIVENDFLLTEPVFDQTEGHFRRATSAIEESVTPTRYGANKADARCGFREWNGMTECKMMVMRL